MTTWEAEYQIDTPPGDGPWTICWTPEDLVFHLENLCDIRLLVNVLRGERGAGDVSEQYRGTGHEVLAKLFGEEKKP